MVFFSVQGLDEVGPQFFPQCETGASCDVQSHVCTAMAAV